MLEEIISIVRRAGEIVRGAHDVERVTSEKSCSEDLVTEYDTGVQAFLRRELLALLPEADFFGEEGEHQTMTKHRTFIVDPIDGTVNFVRGLRYSNVSVALAEGGVVQYGVVYNPYADELFSAARGGGAFLNGRPIRVSTRDLHHGLTLCGSTVYDRSYSDQSFSIMRQIYDLGGDYRRFGAAALDLCQVAAGRAEVFFECRLSPWDFAAGSLIAQEAGARHDVRRHPRRPHAARLHVLHESGLRGPPRAHHGLTEFGRTHKKEPPCVQSGPSGWDIGKLPISMINHAGFFVNRRF